MRKLALMAHLKYKIHKLKGGTTIQTFVQYGTPYSSGGELSSLRAESACWRVFRSFVTKKAVTQKKINLKVLNGPSLRGLQTDHWQKKTLFGQTYKWPLLSNSGRDQVRCHCGSFLWWPGRSHQVSLTRVLIIVKWEWPETAKNRVEPWKRPIVRKRNFFWVVQILAFLAHLIKCPTKKQCEQGA